MIQRYEQVDDDCGPLCGMEHHAEGTWVRYSDVSNLQDAIDHVGRCGMSTGGEIWQVLQLDDGSWQFRQGFGPTLVQAILDDLKKERGA